MKDLDLKELTRFMIFVNLHYELNDVWHFENGNKGINFSGWHNNETGNQKYSPDKLPDNLKPNYKKRNSLEEVYEVYKNVINNLNKY